MAMQSIWELFQFELGDIYDAEQRIAQMLVQLAKECNNGQVKSALQYHEQQTRQQIQNLEQCFQALGSVPQRSTCHAIAGLKQEHDSFLKENPSEEVLTIFDLGGAAKTEHYEIASYRGLIEKANLIGQKDCVRLLQQNLSQEEEMAQKVEQISHQLGQQAIKRRSGQPV
jgi:ferritin-like metal-binding protein YciE